MNHCPVSSVPRLVGTNPSLTLGLLAIALSASACSGDADHPSWVRTIEKSDASNSIGQVCENGQTRACGVKLDARDDIVTCFRGVQTCTRYDWGECLNGQVLNVRSHRSLRESTSSHWFALSTPTTCLANECDPRCQVFDEVPPEPIQSVTRTNPFNWVAGSIGAIPPGLAKSAFKEPCSTADDCQFNTFCDSPTRGTCTHGVCVAGAALADACTPCVSKICDVDPTCCSSAGASPCTPHDPCAIGEKLTRGCSPCVTAICDQKPECCSVEWTDACIDLVGTVCGNTCECAAGTASGKRCYATRTATTPWEAGRTVCQSIGSGWDYVKITDATENAFVKGMAGSSELWIGLKEPTVSGQWRWSVDGTSPTWTAWASGNPGVNTQLNCATGGGSGSGWISRSCSNTTKFGQLCEGPLRMVPAWTPLCVAQVSATCGAYCNTKEPAISTGTCTPWYPGETDPSCGGIDLAVGSPCAMSGCGQASCPISIPICNHGSVEAPAGIDVYHFPAASPDYPKCAPSKSNATKCAPTTEPIPPGKCINHVGCLDPNDQNRSIMVNPQDSSGHSSQTECKCEDNWAISRQGSTCGEPICAGGTSAATTVKKPVDIIFIIDNSSSLDQEIAEVEARINEDFAAIIARQDVDYRVIMFSRYGKVAVSVGESDNPICIKKPLGGNDCVNPISEGLLQASPDAIGVRRFFHYSADIESKNSWCVLLHSYNSPDEAVQHRRTDERAWTPRFPGGWSQLLRANAYKVFVEISDDDVECTWDTYSFDDNDNSTDGKREAEDFHSTLLSLDPTQFGTPAKPNYVWHSIIGMRGSGTTAIQPDAAIETKKCSTETWTGPGIGYQWLSKITGGLRYPICSYSNFNAVFNYLAADIIEQSTVACEYRLPTDQSTIDPQRITLNYASTSGKESVTPLIKVATQSACSGNAWFFDDPGDPTTITLCPDVCTTVTQDPTARVVVEIGCLSPLQPQTVTEKYAGLCETGSTNVWLDLAYKASIFTDGSIKFRARVAETDADLATASWVDLGTATGTTADCPLSSSCSVNVFEKLNSSIHPLAAESPHLELEMTVYPDSSGRSPVLTDYQLTYSCIDNE